MSDAIKTFEKQTAHQNLPLYEFYNIVNNWLTADWKNVNNNNK